MATAAVDVAHLAGYLTFPEKSLQIVLSNPTADLVKTLLEKVAAKAREHEEVQSEKLKLDVELENAVRAGESKSRGLKASVDKGLKEVAELRQKIEAEETNRQSLETELQSLKSTTSTSRLEVSNLKSRIQILESSNRDTLSLLESKTRACDDVTTELSGKHQKAIELKGELFTLEQRLRSAETETSTARFREQSLQQEIDSLKRSNDWLDQELKTKSTEYSKFRKDKLARLAELQRDNEEATTTIEMLRRNDQAVRTRLEEVGQKADDFLFQIQQLRDEAAKQEENFCDELDTANRLAELMKSSLNTEKQRQHDLSERLEKAKEDASDEIGRINAEVETEHQERVAAEQRVVELEIQIERLEADAALHTNSGNLLGSLMHVNVNEPGTPKRSAGSPSRMMSPNLSVSRGGLNFTQMFSEYHTAKAQLEAEKKRNEKLTATIDEMIQEMESRGPEVAELQADHARLESTIVEMSTIIDGVVIERDQATKEARKWEGKIAGMMREGEVLRQQLRDLSSQVKVLLMEVNIQTQGQESFTTEERHRLEQLARGTVDDGLSDDATATDRFISQNLTTFKNVEELEEQNTKLLRITRELGYKLEGEEAQREKSHASQNEEELSSLRDKYERCKDEIKSLVTQSQSYIRERDMFRRMLSHRGQLPPGSDLGSMFGESINGPTTPTRGHPGASIEQSPNSKDMADYAKLLKDMQAHFDSYRREAATDLLKLKEQVDGLSKKNTELKNDMSRKSSEAILTSERYTMLQANYNMLKTENSELQKRSQTLSERAAAQDLRTQQVVEDLVVKEGLLESMRNEAANLKAEKEFWRSVEKRLTEDNQNLLADRDRLTTLTTNLQTLLNEREQSDSDTRRRLQSQVETMESETQSLRRKLNDEADQNKQATLRRELEFQQSQKRIDDLVTSLGSVREELIAAKTTRDHLQARVDEMAIELRSAEERLQVLQPQSLTRMPGEPQSHHLTSTSDGVDVSKEQELALEVSELKRNIELKQNELASAEAQIEQYKAISQSSEEELQSMNETQDQYRAETDRLIEEKSSKVKGLEENLETIQTELSVRNNELASAQRDIAENGQKVEQQMLGFEDEIARLKDTNERTQATAHFYREDLKAQAEIARQAQQSYEDELLKHAEAAKSLQSVRSECNALKLETAELRTESTVARTNLVQSEESWSEAKERYEREITDLKSRRDDMNAQNKLLHQQLETVSIQITRLQQNRVSELDESEHTPDLPSSMTNNLQEIIRYLRREKEIVDVQWELSSREVRRLRQQLEYTQSQLDDARLKLNQQRHAEENSELNALSHRKLMDTINELNIHRESNATLRVEKSHAQASLAEKAKYVEELQSQLQSLRVKVNDLEDSKEALEKTLALTVEARERFEKRYHDIMKKSDSIDPAEFESLKEQLQALRTERDELVVSKQAMQEQVDKIPDQIKENEDSATERMKELRFRLGEQFKARSRELSARISERDATIQLANQGKEELERQYKALQQDLTAAKQAREDEIKARQTTEAELPKGATQNGSEDGQVNEEDFIQLKQSDFVAMQEKLNSAESRALEEAAKYTQLRELHNALLVKISELETEISTSRQNTEQANIEISRLQHQIEKGFQQQSEQMQQPKKPLDGTSDEQLEKLQKDLDQAHADVDALRDGAVINAAIANVQVADGFPSIADQIVAQAAEIRTQLTARHDERIHLAEESFKKKTDQMKQMFNAKLKELVAKRVADKEIDMAQIQTQAIEELKTQHQKEIEGLNNRHKDELDELRMNEETRFEQFRQSWVNQHGAEATKETSAVNGDTTGKPTKVELTETEIRDLIRDSEVAKSIVRSNLAKQREALVAKTREEELKSMNEKLVEAESKANIAREQAVNLEGKKFSVKLNMTENRYKLAQQKLTFVQKAATETPEKPVAEIWMVAKDIKLAPPIPVSAPQVNHGSQVPKNPFAAVVGSDSGPSTSTNQSPSNGILRQSMSVSGPMPPPSSPSVQKHEPSSIASEAITAAQGEQPPPTEPNENSSTLQVNAANNQNSSKAQQDQGSAEATRLPNKPLQAYGGPRGNTGTGAASFRGSSQSGLPIPSSIRVAIPQGPGNGRGQQQQGNRNSQNVSRGRGTGRGQMAQVQSGLAQNSSQPQEGSPRSLAPLSATAKQFVPNGSKRPRDEGLEASQHANENAKRMRGTYGFQ